jgi:Dockerin type I domain
MNPDPSDSDPNDPLEPGLELPETLRAELARLTKADLFVPAEVDEAVLGPARARMREIRREGRTRRLVVGVAAVAAAVLLSVGVGLALSGSEQAPAPQQATRQADGQGDEPRPPAPDPAPEEVVVDPLDVDADGRLDVLDALALARAVEAGQALSPAWDLTGDGVVDRGDADALARRLVDLERGS